MDGGKKSAWLKAVMAAKKPGMSLGDAMKAAKKTYKKTGGQLMGKGTVAGSRKRGGQLYSFTGGPYASSELTDGAGRFPPYNLNSMQFPGANPNAMTGARRRRRSSKGTRKTRKNRK